MRELDLHEIDQINGGLGGGCVRFVGQAIAGGAIYDGVKAGVSAAGEAIGNAASEAFVAAKSDYFADNTPRF